MPAAAALAAPDAAFVAAWLVVCLVIFVPGLLAVFAAGGVAGLPEAGVAGRVIEAGGAPAGETRAALSSAVDLRWRRAITSASGSGKRFGGVVIVQ
ncbi:hypothetical protein GCM10027419_30840 [Pandoraea terrae]